MQDKSYHYTFIYSIILYERFDETVEDLMLSFMILYVLVKWRNQRVNNESCAHDSPTLFISQ